MASRKGGCSILCLLQTSDGYIFSMQMPLPCCGAISPVLCHGRPSLDSSGPELFFVPGLSPLLAGCGSLETSVKLLLVRHSGCRSTTRAARLSVEPCLYAARVMASATASASVRGLGTSPGRLGMMGACTSSPGLCLAPSAWRASGPVDTSGEACFAVAGTLGSLPAVEKRGRSSEPSAFRADASASVLSTRVPASTDGGAGELTEGTGSRGMALGRTVMGASLPAEHHASRPISVVAMYETLTTLH